MDSYSMQNPAEKRATGLKALLMEIGVIIILVIIMLFVLNYFKIINFGTLIPFQSSSKPDNSVSKVVSTQSANLQSTDATNLNKLQNNNALHYATTITEFEGIISSIDTKGGKILGGNKEYAVKIILRLGTGNDTFTTYFSQESLSRTKVNIKAGNELKSIKLSDLKVGDRIVIKETADRMGHYPNVLLEAIITKNP